MLISFLICLIVFATIGLLSARLSRGTQQDYYLASASIRPWLVGLSAVATNNSGYMFIGVIGYTYVTGLASIWLMLGWILGDLLASMYVHQRLRQASERTGEVSYAGVLASWQEQGMPWLQRLAGLISLVFLLAYAGAQLVAGSKALHVLLNWPDWLGAVLGAILVMAYCFAGGIRASIWTDAAQSVVMIFAMGLLLTMATSALGGPAQALGALHEIDSFMDWFPKDLVVPGVTGGVLFAASWLAAGFSVIGQPHIMVRFMTLQQRSSMTQARLWYYLWFSLFYAMATAVGLLSRLYLPENASFDAELALPTMAMQLLPEAFVGLILAGIFAATLSTADSLLLSCSATVTHDLLPHSVERLLLLKLATLLMTLLALAWALLNDQSVFGMVIMAWSGLASAFAPLLLALCFGCRPSQKTAIVAMFTGFIVALLWRYAGLHGAVYEGLPGILAGLMVIGAGHCLSSRSACLQKASGAAQ